MPGIEVPSGAMYGDSEFELLKLMHRTGSIARTDTPVRFKGGVESNVYVLLRDDLTEEPELQAAIGTYLISVVHRLRGWSEPTRRPCLIGVPTAATPFASAVSLSSYFNRDFPIAWRQMRPEKKTDHGASAGWTNRPPSPKHLYMTIEQVTSSGTSLCNAIQHLGEDGYPVHDMNHLIFVDWEFGGPELLRSKGYPKVTSLFKMRDVAYAYQHMGIWDASMVAKVNATVAKGREH